jgi:CheY-like chemotaxis protein
MKRRIRQQAGSRDIMLIALTGWGQEEDRRRSKEARFDHHLTKPVEFAALRKLLVGSTPRAFGLAENDSLARSASADVRARASGW